MHMTPTFIHNGQLYAKIVPSKRLFNSTMIHDVVTRGDFFALNITTGEFTILPGSTTTDNNPSQYLRSVDVVKESRDKLIKLCDQIKKDLKGI